MDNKKKKKRKPRKRAVRRKKAAKQKRITQYLLPLPKESGCPGQPIVKQLTHKRKAS
jgi:hypothetical protein